MQSNMLTNASLRGQQIGTYRLQLPYKYSILLITLSAVLHFLLSESSYVLLYLNGKYIEKDTTHRIDTDTNTACKSIGATALTAKRPTIRPCQMACMLPGVYLQDTWPDCWPWPPPLSRSPGFWVYCDCPGTCHPLDQTRRP
jgi:hypothetical protein